MPSKTLAKICFAVMIVASIIGLVVGWRGRFQPRHFADETDTQLVIDLLSGVDVHSIVYTHGLPPMMMGEGKLEYTVIAYDASTTRLLTLGFETASTEEFKPSALRPLFDQFEDGLMKQTDHGRIYLVSIPLNLDEQTYCLFMAGDYSLYHGAKSARQ